MPSLLVEEKIKLSNFFKVFDPQFKNNVCLKLEGEKEFTYSNLSYLVSAVASKLEETLKEGEKYSIALYSNRPFYQAVIFFAVLLSGNIPIFMNSSLALEEAERHFDFFIFFEDEYEIDSCLNDKAISLNIELLESEVLLEPIALSDSIAYSDTLFQVLRMKEETAKLEVFSYHAGICLDELEFLDDFLNLKSTDFIFSTPLFLKNYESILIQFLLPFHLGAAIYYSKSNQDELGILNHKCSWVLEKSVSEIFDQKNSILNFKYMKCILNDEEERAEILRMQQLGLKVFQLYAFKNSHLIAYKKNRIVSAWKVFEHLELSKKEGRFLVNSVVCPGYFFEFNAFDELHKDLSLLATKKKEKNLSRIEKILFQLHEKESQKSGDFFALEKWSKRYLKHSVILPLASFLKTKKSFFKKLLSSLEKELYRQYKQKASRMEFLSGRVFLKYCVLESLDSDLDFSHLQILRELTGAPYLMIKNERQKTPYLSLTHKKKFLFAACADEAFGIDIEKISTRLEKVKKRFISDEEEEIILKSSQEHILLYTKLWTSKEALVKLLRSDFMEVARAAKLLEINENQMKIKYRKRLFFVHHYVFDDYVFAIAKEFKL